MQHHNILKNRAHLTNESEETVNCEHCGGEVVFALRDNHHEFSMSLSAILQCLHFAEKEGLVPPLGAMWWSRVNSRYCLDTPDHLTDDDPADPA